MFSFLLLLFWSQEKEKQLEVYVLIEKVESRPKMLFKAPKKLSVVQAKEDILTDYQSGSKWIHEEVMFFFPQVKPQPRNGHMEK